MREPRTLLLEGCLRLAQPAEGYRVNVDALLLAAFAAEGRAVDLVVDLGAGVGTVGLLLERAGVAQRLALVEREPDLAALAERNLSELGVKGTVYTADLASGGLPRPLVQRAALVVSNPPFFAPGTGRPRKDTRQRRARSGELDPFLRAAAQALAGPKSRAAFVYPAPALPALLASAEAAGLVAKRLRLVHAKKDVSARLALVELRRAKPGGLVIEPPLVEWARAGQRSPELSAIVAGRNRRPPEEAPG